MKKINKIFNVTLVCLRYLFFYLYCMVKNINNDTVWIISERGNDARDNSYHMFRYIRKNHPNVDIRYIISKNSPDYSKIKEFGGIIEYGSKEHYVYLITAGILISTHIMGYTPDMSLFWRLDRHHLLKLKGKRVFLQHGITKDFMNTMTSDISKIDLFICGAKPEYEYILNNYGHPKGVVKYTGLARYDCLDSSPKRQILLMPTFRKWLNYTNAFESSEYFKTYNNLMNNKSLDSLLKSYNYELVFYPHYEIQKKIGSFKIKNKKNNIVIADFNNYDVQKLLIESDLLITDYSSVFFDFAFMKKPIVYYQFDIDKYRDSHYSEGYFSYINNGFGPVVTEEAQLLNLIANNFINNFKVEDIYKKRTGDFFVLNDKHNCERIYKDIIKLTKN